MQVLSRKSTKNKSPVIDNRKPSHTNLDARSAIISERPKSVRDLEQIKNALSRHFIFSSLTEENRDEMISRMRLFNVGPRELIFSQGQQACNFFVIAHGTVQVQVNGRAIKELSTGESFGELALLHNSLRSATIKTLTNTALWGIDRKTFRSALESIHAQEYQSTRTFVENVPLFSSLSPLQREALIASLSSLKFRPHEKIVNEGDPGDLFFIIVSGSVNCIQRGRELRQMHPGEFFGEQALLYQCPRTASIIALEDVRCLAIGRQRLIKVLGSQLQQIIYRNSLRMALEKSQLFLCTQGMHQLIDRAEMLSFERGQVVIPQNTPKGECLWVVVNGLLESENCKFEVFTCIGEEDLFSEQPGVHTCDIVCSSDQADVAVIPREELSEYLSPSMEQTQLLNLVFASLKKGQIFMGLPDQKLRELSRAFQLVQFEPNQKIIEQHSEGESFFMVHEGTVDVFRDDVYIRTITKNDYFGERSLLFNNRRSATVVCNGPVSCWMLLKSEFYRMIDENIQTQLIKRIDLQDISVKLEDLVIVKKLGRGKFAIVYLVFHKLKQRLFALKVISKGKISQFELQEKLRLERKVLLRLDHVLIMKKLRTFVDPERVYFLLEFVNGKDLFDVIRKIGLFSEKDSKFYIAGLLEILEHLHERNILYRDLKPEHIMVDEDGYPKLIDFGTAKIIEGRTFTMLGTPHYMAPEVIIGKGYGVSADLWSLGVILYELLCGKVPFGEEEENPFVVYQIILEDPVIYTCQVKKESSVKALIEQLLSKNCALRGCASNFKNHEWFKSFSWYGLLMRQLRPPYKPKVRGFQEEIDETTREDLDIRFIIRDDERADDIPSKEFSNDFEF